MPTYKLTVCYDGTDFHGWQRQEPPGLPPLRTVQGVLEAAVRETVRAPITLTGASRTDAGVHAEGQVAVFAAETRIPVDRLPLAISSRLPDDVQVTAASLAREGFDPISEAVSKCYRYSLGYPTPERRLPPVFERRFVAWQVHRLDIAAMAAAAQQFVGEHDFVGFAHATHGKQSTVRRVHQCTVSNPRPGRIEIDIAGNGFLYNMVRIIAGTLRDVGRGRIAARDIAAVIASGDRARAGDTLPACGLCLRWIHYGGRDVPEPESMPGAGPGSAAT